MCCVYSNHAVRCCGQDADARGAVPAFARIIPRGTVSDIRSDVSSLELFAVSAHSAVPFAVSTHTAVLFAVSTHAAVLFAVSTHDCCTVCCEYTHCCTVCCKYTHCCTVCCNNTWRLLKDNGASVTWNVFIVQICNQPPCIFRDRKDHYICFLFPGMTTILH